MPTRNRVENALELMDSFYETTVRHDSGLLFIVGTEDPRYDEYLREIPERHLLTFPERGLVKALNYASPLYWDDYAALGFMGDDHRPRTLGWDQMYVKGLESLGGGYVYGNDLLMGERIPTQVAISSSIVKSLGFFGPPGFWHLYVDNTWKDMGDGLKRLEYLPDVIIEHMHYTNGKSSEDSGYRHVNSEITVRHDEAEYFRWKREDYPDQLRTVSQALEAGA